MVVLELGSAPVVWEKVPKDACYTGVSEVTLNGGEEALGQLGRAALDQDSEVGVGEETPHRFPLGEDGAFQVTSRPEDELEAFPVGLAEPTQAFFVEGTEEAALGGAAQVVALKDPWFLKCKICTGAFAQLFLCGGA